MKSPAHTPHFDGGLPDEARTALADRVGQLIIADE